MTKIEHNMAKTKLKVKELAIANGIPNAYQLQVKAGLYPSHAAQLFAGTSKKISLEVIDKLCDTFDCAPGDLFERIEETPEPKKKARTTRK